MNFSALCHYFKFEISKKFIKNHNIFVQQSKTHKNINQDTQKPTKKMNKSAMSQQIDKYLRQIHDLIAIIISDNEGVHIFNASHQEPKQKLQKIIQTSTMLISTVTQCQGNFEQINQNRIVNPLTYYYDEYLIHFRKNKYFNVTLFMRPRASGLLAEEISQEIMKNFQFLNAILAKKE